MKWINESNIQFNCGNHEPCIFKFDNSKMWFMFDALCSTQTVRAEARKLGQAYGAKEVTIKYLWDGENSTEPRTSVVDFFCHAGKYRFYIPTVSGATPERHPSPILSGSIIQNIFRNEDDAK